MNGNSTQADAWVQRAFLQQKAGEVAAAMAACEQALTLQEDHADALQLLGLLVGKQGDVQRAETLMRASLVARPAQPHVWNNLGNLLLRTGRETGARGCFEQALSLNPDYADAYYNLARALVQCRQLENAAVAVKSALATAPAPTPAMLQLQAQIEADQGQLAQALVSVDQALALAPDRPALLHNKATLLQRVHRYAEALSLHEQAATLGLDAADAHYNRGNTLQSLGRSDEALAAYRLALAAEPQHALALHDLARLRWRMGDADFDKELHVATQAAPNSAVAPGVHAQLLWRAERYEAALAAFQTCLDRQPDVAAWHDGVGRCLVRLGQVEPGLAAHQRALQLAPRHSTWHSHFAASLLRARRPEPAAEAAQLALALTPADQQTWALLGLAWRLLGDPRETWLNDYARLVSVCELPTPPGFASLENFNRALAQELVAQHHDRAAPLDQTLRGGTQTVGDLFQRGLPCVDLLKDGLRGAIDRYIADLPVDHSHPFLKRRATSWRFNDAWSSSLGDGGFHTNHVHPHGWISSAYYVALPDSTQDTSRCEGWLQFGQPDFDAGLENPVRKQVQPRAGQLVLFPSMFWHGTTPFGEAAQRLTIAFDAAPA